MINKMKFLVLLSLCVLSAGAFALPLTGKTIEGANSAGGFLPSSQAIVGAGVEFTSADWYGYDWFQIDISESGFVQVDILDVNLGHGASHLLTFSDVLSQIDNIVGFDFVASGGGVTGFDQSKLGFTADTFSIQLGEGVGWGSAFQGYIQGQLQFAAVSAPSTIALLLVGFAGLMFARRRA